MIEILGPTYRYQGEILTRPEVIYINDHHYNEDDKDFQVRHLLENSACDPQQHLLVFDHFGHDDVLSKYPHVDLPVYLAADVVSFGQQGIIPDWNLKTHCFNFMINKPRQNRIRLLDFVEQNNLTHRLHTLPWQSSDWPSIPTTNYLLGEEEAMQRGVKNRHYSNAMTYQKLLQRTVFEPTCVSLITEPCYIEREVMITEKTLMAMYGGTLPIWVGGWRIPDAMRDLGFDVFDDVIDHRYSTLPDPADRLDQALTKNIDLLRDFETVSKFIKQNIPRLQHNLELIKQNVFLNMINEKLKDWPQLHAIVAMYGFKAGTEPIQ
jgi:hypothetical protein